MTFYDHDMIVTRPASTDGLGRKTGSSSTVYDGKAEIQEQAVQKRGHEGQVVTVGDAQGFLPDTESVQDWEAGDTVTVTRPDGTSFEATVESVTRLDNSFVLSKDR